MFVFNRIKTRAANGLDLAIEFSTLGEYGFLPQAQAKEYPGSTGRAAAPNRLATVTPTEIRSRRPDCSPADRPRPAWREGGADSPPRTASLAAVPRIQVIGALRTPRLQTDWAA